MSYQRSNDGLDPSSTTDAYERNNRRELDDEVGVRVNDGLSTSNTTDTQASHGSRSREEEEALTGRSEYATSGSDAFDGRRDDYEHTSGGLGHDDTRGSNARTGGVDRASDQEASDTTSGGLGANDTYGTEKDTGGNDTGHDHNYGMGTGRTVEQEQGGIFPTEKGRIDIDEGDESHCRTHDKKSDSKIGKLLEETGKFLHNQNLESKGEKKRSDAGAHETVTN